ncbi:TIGR03086 family protein [Nocardioides sp. dk4132]|uniref:maleylpyruvate isomerase N-terminal domain-containing protein n=1 Tax=unclassified Nocardioides TaxID=2615069 RepID=UPI001296D140|nr:MULTISPECIES: maleylpyruvate isomerase N-terminal domain-containing protein [unclassified Nocardioides]MQW76976.1 TIGR03086 family protein [Nocardioides sp. dk4132]QGA09393.1 TIGR03086 family protein [Nocardioides sp. dk884]
MRTRLDAGVELLERSLAYACGVLAEVSESDLARPTPCAAWDLDRLLAHLEDALGAFEEAATGSVSSHPAPESGRRVDELRRRATAVLGAWVGAPDALPPRVRLGDAELDTALLLHTAALEVTVHAHDVAVATAAPGAARPLPEELARGLLAVAQEVVGPDDRPGRFAAPRSTRADPTYAELLLGYLGR